MSISRFIGGDDFEASLLNDKDKNATKGDLYTAYKKAKKHWFLTGAVIFSIIVGTIGLIIAFLALSGSGVLYNVLTGKVNISDASTSYMDAAFGK